MRPCRCAGLQFPTRERGPVLAQYRYSAAAVDVERGRACVGVRRIELDNGSRGGSERTDEPGEHDDIGVRRAAIDAEILRRRDRCNGSWHVVLGPDQGAVTIRERELVGERGIQPDVGLAAGIHQDRVVVGCAPRAVGIGRLRGRCPSRVGVKQAPH